MGSWERTQLGQLTQTGQRDILYHMASCSEYKLGGVGWAGIAAQEQAGYWLSDGEQMHPCITCFVYSVITVLSSFVILLIYLYLNPRVSLFFFNSPPTSCRVGGGREQTSGCMVLSCWLGLNHNSGGLLLFQSTCN